MKKLFRLCTKALLVSAILTLLLSGAALADDNTIDIVVSPNVLNIESNGGSISIHTDIGYVPAENVTVEVNKVEIVGISTDVDDRGNLVVKCDIDEVKGIVIPDQLAFFDLICDYDGDVYRGSDSVPVIRIIPQKPS